MTHLLCADQSFHNHIYTNPCICNIFNSPMIKHTKECSIVDKINNAFFLYRLIFKHVYTLTGYKSLNVMRQSTCLVFNPITVDAYAAFFNCTPVGRASNSMMARHKAIYFDWMGPELLVCCLAHRVSTGVFLLLRS